MRWAAQYYVPVGFQRHSGTKMAAPVSCEAEAAAWGKESNVLLSRVKLCGWKWSLQICARYLVGAELRRPMMAFQRWEVARGFGTHLQLYWMALL